MCNSGSESTNDGRADRHARMIAAVIEAMARYYLETGAARVAGRQSMPPADQPTAPIDEPLRRLVTQVEVLVQSDANLQHLSKVMMSLSADHFRERVVVPMTFHLAQTLDWLDRQHQSWQGHEQVPGAEAAAFLEAMRVQILEFLGVYGVEPLDAPAGSRFDPRTMKPAEGTPPMADGQVPVVESTVRLGLAWEGKAIRPQTVSLRSAQ